MEYDFSGWATRNDLKCSDGRTIRKDAFKDCDGMTVPLVWNHQHNNTGNVLGHALLENRSNGVYCYGFLNDTKGARDAKEMLKHGDVKQLSIYANKLVQDGGNVLHGLIREVSLVLAGANPGAYIDNVLIHSADGEEIEIDDEAIIYPGENASEMVHYDKEDKPEEKKGDKEMPSDNKENSGEKTVKDVIDSMTEEQKTVMYAIIGQAVEEAKNDKSDDEGGDGEVAKHNIFENDYDNNTYLSHEEQRAIIADAKKFGSLKESFLAHAEAMGLDADSLMHDADSDAGIVRSENKQDYFVNDPSFLFPDAKYVNGPTPAWIKRPTEWVAGVMSGTKHAPFARVKTIFADITEDEARAKGYIKGNMKKEEVFTMLKRSTDPTTVYKKQKMDRDDIVDITDFDVVAWIRSEMRMMLDEELARAILVGDGRLSSSDDKINETHIRPIWTDHDLFTIKKVVTFASNATDDDKAKAVIKASVKARKDYRGSGRPTLFTTEDWLTNMLLLEDTQGYRLYKSESEVASAMRVANIVTVPVMENLSRTVDGVQRDLIGIIVNLTDYTVGADKGGAVSMFEGFDIDYNQQKYLMETRCSGALTVPYSAIALESVTSAG